MGRGREADRWETRRGRGAHGGAGSRRAQRPRAGGGGGQWQQWHEGAGNGSGSSKTSEGSASRSAARARAEDHTRGRRGSRRRPRPPHDGTNSTPAKPSGWSGLCRGVRCTVARRRGGMCLRAGGPDTRRAARCWPRYDRIEKKYIHEKRVAPQPTLKRIAIGKTRRKKKSIIQAHAHMSKRETEERGKNARPAAPGRRTCSGTRHGADG